ncbi:MAG: N-acetyltransferase [Clostridium sp.]|nr:N-acetyltransferase [Clostridium sp.]
MPTIDLERQLRTSPNRVWVEDESGREIAYISFPEAGNGLVNIEHTVVDPAYEGQGIAARMMLETVETIRKDGKHTLVTCSYAQAWFCKHMEYMFLLVDPDQAEALRGI